MTPHEPLCDKVHKIVPKLLSYDTELYIFRHKKRLSIDSPVLYLKILLIEGKSLIFFIHKIHDISYIVYF